MMPTVDDQMPMQEQQENAATPEVDDKVKALLLSLAKKVNAREQTSRMREIWDSAEQRYFYKGEQFGFVNRDAGVYQVGQAGGGFNTYGDGSVEPTFTKSYNIYLGYGKSFMAVFCQSDAPTRAEPEDPKDNDDIAAAREANKMVKVVDKYNPPRLLQTKLAKFLWTDSRCVAHTHFVEDGERFGYEGTAFTDEAEGGIEVPTPPRQAKGREVIDLFGTLETKIPLTANSIHDWDYCKISKDIPLSTLKAKYREAAKGVSGSTPSGPDMLARMARIGTRQGARQLSEDAIAFLTTEDYYWFRPRLFSELGDDDRDTLLQLFPDGCRLVASGNNYLQSFNESMNDHLAVMYGMEDEGGGRISLGAPEVPLQKEFNDDMNFASEIIKYCCPAGWVDPEAVDIEAVQEQQANPGNRYPIKKGARANNEPMSNLFYTEQALQFPAGLVDYLGNLQGPLSQFLTGQQPALFGGEMADQKTARGYAMARDQAMGLMALVWLPFKEFRSTYIGQAVAISANERIKRGQQTLSTYVPIPGKNGATETVDVAIEDLKGNVVWSPITDENFPESYTQKSNKFMQLIQFAAQDPMITQVMTDPGNLALAKDLLGLTDFVIPGADDEDKQLLEIAEMRQQPPVPDMTAVGQEFIQAMQTTGQPPQLDPATLPMTSSVPLGKYDNDANELKVCIDWINGPEGQAAKRSPNDADKAWYENVELHAGLHQQRLIQVATQQAAAMAVMQPQKPAVGEPGKNNEGSLEKPQQTPPEGGLPQTSGPAENPSPLM